jgi:hypothetical protein
MALASAADPSDVSTVLATEKGESLRV